MKKQLSNLLFILLIIFLSIEVIKENDIVINAVKSSFYIWQNNIFPSLFPFFIFGNILISLGFPNIIGEIFKNIFNKLFKINPNGVSIIFLSILSGFPSSAKYITQLLENGSIDNDDATKLLMFTHFSNPLFIIGTVSIFIGSKSIALCVLISHYIGNFIVGIIFKEYKKKELTSSSINFKNILNYINANNIGSILANSIKNAIETLLLILGSVTVFLIITSILNNLLSINGIYASIFNGLFEMTQGLKYLETVSTTPNIKGLIAVIILSFGGLSVHLQTITIISNTNIKYFPYFISRILHALISALIFYFWKVF